MKATIKLLTWLILMVSIYTDSYAQNENQILLKSAKIFDSEKGEFKKADILIKVNSILSVADNINSNLPNTRLIDLKDHTVIPGLIDMHTHVLESVDPELSGPNGLILNILTQHDIYRGSRAIPYLRSYLYEGFTSIRDVGNSGQFGDVALKKAVNDGLIESPRLFVSGPILSSSGGQIAGILDHHQDIIAEEYRIIKNEDDAIQAVREHVNQGENLIKICTDNSPNRTYLTVGEIEQITRTAHEYGLKVTAHANTPKSIENAIKGNVDGIEHGYLINDELSKKLSEQNISITITDFYLSDFGKEYLKESGTPDASIKFIQKTVKERLFKVIENNKFLVFGSDVYVDIKASRGKAAKEILISYNKDYNIPVSKVLQFATCNAAVAMGKEDELGNIEQGLKADFIVLKGDLEEDIEVLNNVVYVLKDGDIIKSP